MSASRLITSKLILRLPWHTSSIILKGQDHIEVLNLSFATLWKPLNLLEIDQCKDNLLIDRNRKAGGASGPPKFIISTTLVSKC